MYIYIYIYICTYINVNSKFQFFLLDLQHLNLILYALCFSLEYGNIETYH